MKKPAATLRFSLSRSNRLFSVALVAALSATLFSASPTLAAPPNVFSKPVAHDAEFWPTTKAFVRAGDMMRATVIRPDREVPMTTTDAKWVSRIAWLNAVTTAGVHKALTFSAVEDVRNLLPYVPKDVDYLEYNMERGMTPESDYADMALSVATFSKLVRDSGRKFKFGPIRNTWTALENKGEFTAVVKNCDSVSVQMQRAWQANPTQEALLAEVRPLVRKFKAANPEVKVNIQLWLGRQTVSQMIEGFRTIEEDLDLAVLGTHSNPQGVLQVLQALRGSSGDVQATRPNVIVIVVDDLRFDEFGAGGHPYLQTPNIDRLAAEGAMFQDAFNAVPLCSPNRASILTGQYPSRHGIIDNVARDRASHRLETFPQALQRAGYETGFLGKWHMGNDPTPRPGFDYWAAIPGQGLTVDPEIFENGRLQKVKGYITDLLTDRAVEFIERERNRPFFLYIGHKAVHPDVHQLEDGSVDPNHPRAYIPAPRHKGLYEEKVYPRQPNVVSSADELKGKPALQRSLRNRNSPEMVEEFSFMLDLGTSEETIRRRAEMVLAVDEGLGRMMTVLEERGILENTMIVFTSDNGFFFGEHWLSQERRLPYEESVRLPLIVRYPPLAEPGSRIGGLSLSIDIAPTVLEVGGAEIGRHIQGRSLVPLLRGDHRQWRESILIEFYTYENPRPWLLDMDYRAVRTNRHKLIHWIQHPEERELYDLVEDPYEMRNLIDDPSMKDVLRDLEGELSRLVLEAMGLEEGSR